MKILSLWQPWATLLASGAKKVETRSWTTSYRGPVVIHSAKGGISVAQFSQLLDDDSAFWALAAKCYQLSEPQHGKDLAIDYFTRMPRGCALAIGEIVETMPTVKAAALMESGRWFDERPFGDYGPDRFAWRFDRITRLVQPVPMRGRQGLKPLAPDEEALIRAAIIGELPVQVKRREPQGVLF